MSRRLHLPGACLALLLWPALAAGQSLDTEMALGLGSGLSLGDGGGNSVLVKRSPLALELEVGLVFDGDRSLEWTPGIVVELDGPLAVAFNPQLKKLLWGKRWAVYGGLGIPFFFAPFTMLGVEAALGGVFQLMPRLGIALEFRTDVFFAGSEIPDGAALVKLDLALSLRLRL